MPFLKPLLQGRHCTSLRASGLDVGLPRGVMGNSEVGHLALGTGRVVFQALARISLAIEDGSFARNPALTQAVDASKGKALHLLGLVSDGGVHAQLEHVLALLDLAEQRGQRNVVVHALLDGRDMPAKSALPLLERLAKHAERTGARVADVGGRFFGMDRDARWERVRPHFDCMVHGRGLEAPGWRAALEAAYARGETDEFVQPTRCLPGKEGLLGKGDHVLLWNFRPDRMRQLCRALWDPAFAAFPRGGAGPWPVTAMTTYDASFPVPVAFPAEKPTETLGEVVAAAGRTQLRVAETEKYAHVTYFFNGGEERQFPGEQRILVPSKRDKPTYDLVPEMSAREITDALLPELAKGHGLIVLNFANPDMCGHTGNLAATVRACEVVDACLARLVPAARAQGFEVFLTADHGNAELMEVQGQPHKAHTTNPVPLAYVGARTGALREGGLSDVAPTVLEAMGLPKPPGMNGQSLFTSAP